MLGVAIVIIPPPGARKPSYATDPRWHKETLDRILSSEPSHRNILYIRTFCILHAIVPPISIALISWPQLLEVCVKITKGNNKVLWRRVKWYIDWLIDWLTD